MKIELRQIPIRDVFAGFSDNGEGGVVGYRGKLDIRPPYQREFVYRDNQRDEVMRTIMKGFPLNVMYWAVREDGGYEILDGQQRTLSFCQYLNDDFSVKFNDGDFPQTFTNLTTDQKEKILNYPLQIYFCEGTDSEKLSWFKIINIAGEKLTAQELRNAVYHGSWLAAAKPIFSRPNGPADNLSKKYVSANVGRQELLETALAWKSNGEIEEYMSAHQNDQNANELWLYFQNVINWARETFTVERKEMRSVNWGKLFDEFGDATLNTADLESEIAQLMLDDDVTKKSGIYDYVLTRNERVLSIRAFSQNQRREAYERQKGICPFCANENREKIHYEIQEMEADHILPWSKGGKTIAANCQMLCREHNNSKGGI